jgi:DeoR/GlpR family transcriptional regulator of sugar metabolism
MLTHERKRLLLANLKKDGRIIAKDASRKLKLSEDTIRRDLRELAAEGLLARVHGGALPASPTVANLKSRRSMSMVEKTRLANAAAPLIAPGQIVFFDGGTTNLELVRALPSDIRFTAVTHSPTIAAALEAHEHVDVIIIGGKLFRHSMVASGAAALSAIADIRVDLFFLGITGLHNTEGLTTGDFEEAQIKRAIVGRSAEIVSLVTSEKLGAASAHRVGPTAQLSTLVVARAASLPPLPKAVRVVRAG